MSFKVYFTFAAGLKEAMKVRSGMIAVVRKSIADVEESLGIQREVYNGETRWNSFPLCKNAEKISDEDYCNAVENHNRTVRWFYERLREWSKKPPTDETELLTPEIFGELLIGLQTLDVPVERWSNDYYRARMESFYEAIRGRESEGMSFDAKSLTEHQAASVIVLLSQWLDSGDIRLDVIKGTDQLAASYDGGYSWCESCGAVDPNDIDEDEEKCRKCKRRRTKKPQSK